MLIKRQKYKYQVELNELNSALSCCLGITKIKYEYFNTIQFQMPTIKGQLHGNRLHHATLPYVGRPLAQALHVSKYYDSII